MKLLDSAKDAALFFHPFTTYLRDWQKPVYECLIIATEYGDLDEKNIYQGSR